MVLQTEKMICPYIALSFLDQRQCTATCLSDDVREARVDVASIGVNQKAIRKQYTHVVPMRLTRKSVNAQGALSVAMLAGGGFVAWITPDM